MFLKALFVISSLFVIPCFSWQVEKIKGVARLNRAGVQSELSKGELLQIGDIVSTGKNSKIVLTEDKDSHIYLGSRTKFKIEKTEKNKASDDLLSLTLKIFYGKMRAVIQKDNPKLAKKYKYKSKTAVAGVRGTEFFISVDDNEEQFCTLEGSVEVITDSANKFIVEEGKGLKLTSSHSPKMNINSKKLVDSWVAQTSIENESVDTNYLANSDRFYDTKQDKLFYGFEAHSFWCESNKTGSKSCLWTYLRPSIKYGKRTSLVFKPAFNFISNSEDKNLDDVPLINQKSMQSFSVSELYLEGDYSNWQLSTGLQAIVWADEILLSERLWSMEPQTHLAIRAIKQWDEVELELLVGPGYEDRAALKGHSNVELLGAKLAFPRKGIETYFLHTEFDKQSSLSSNLDYENQMSHLGVFVDNDWGHLDYRFSAIYQKHSLDLGSSKILDQKDDGAMDLDLGYNLGLSMPMRFGLRYIYATKSFTNVLEDNYRFGLSGFTQVRGNLKQMRVKYSLQVFSDQVLTMEYFKSKEVDSTGQVRQLSSTGKDGDIGSEINLSYHALISRRWGLYSGVWRFFPGTDNSENETKTGFSLRLEFKL